MSDSDFDDDDELLLGLIQATLKKPSQTQNPAQNDDLLRAQGEISILRAQLEAAQAAKNDEMQKLQKKVDGVQNSLREHISALKQTVDKLEDEKKFLANEIRSLSGTKRRKYNQKPEIHVPRVAPDQKPLAISTKLQVDDDWSQLCLHIWHYTINGASSSSIDFLSRITIDEPIFLASGERIEKIPLSAAIWTALLTMKQLRLDIIISRFCLVIFDMTSKLLAQNRLAAVPFLISIVYGCVNFKTSAVTKELAGDIVLHISNYSHTFIHVLQEQEYGDASLPDQTRLLQHATLLFCFDLLENIVVICTQFGAAFVQELWAQNQLMKQILPENTERFVSSAQINLVYNFVEILSASMTDMGFYKEPSADQLTVKSLIKVLLIDIPPKEDFFFYGLNRILGNNHDTLLLEQAIPKNVPENLGLVILPFPIRRPAKDKTEMLLAHENHLLSLRLHIVTLLESVLVSGNMELLNLKENIKSVTRIIGFEQNMVLHQPRDRKVYLRIEIIGVLIRILYYIIEEHKNINDLIFPETLYEIFVILMRIAFSSDSLLLEAHDLLSEIRRRGVTLGVFNRECETRSREVSHFNLHDPRINKYAELANVEGDFANGLEFPYDAETVEIAREILAVCVNHDEADNLYFNMTRSQ